MKRVLITSTLVLAVAGLAFAGDMSKKATNGDAKAHLEQVKAELAKCAVCKNMLTHFDELAPVMKNEIVKMNNGMGVMHTITDAKKVAIYHTDCDAMAKAAEGMMAMTDEEAKASVCDFCQEMRSLMKSGAMLSAGKTENGHLLVVMSADPALQSRIDKLHAKCVAEMAGMPE